MAQIRIPVTGGTGSGEANTASNQGGGAGIFSSKVGVDLKFKSLVAGANITITSAATEITIASAAGTGEANTSSSVGAGASLVKPKVGVNLPFKSLVAGANITLTQNVDDVTIAAVGGGGSTAPGGIDAQVQYNNGGVFGGAANLIYDDIAGHVGIGGVVPNTTLHVEKAVAGDKIAFFNNTSVTGFGVRMQTGLNTNYGLKVCNAAGVGQHQMFGLPIHHIGPETTSWLTALLANTFPQSILAIHGGSASGFDAALSLTSGDNLMTSMLYMTGGDRGMRLSWNYRQPAGANGNYADPAYHMIQQQFETDASWSINTQKPFNTAAGVWDIGGKTFKIYGAGYVEGVGPSGARTEFTAIVNGNLGRGLEFGTCTSVNSDYRMKLRISGTHTEANPIFIWTNGALKQITVDAIDTAGVGFRGLRVPN